MGRRCQHCCIIIDQPTEDATEPPALRESATAYIHRLEAREAVLAVEEAHTNEAAKARAILKEPHSPFTCPTFPPQTSGLVASRESVSVSSPSNTSINARAQCAALLSVTGKRCGSTPKRRNRFCSPHRSAHHTERQILVSETDALEKLRAKTAEIEVGRGNVTVNRATTYKYITSLEAMLDQRAKHQSTYCCEGALRLCGSKARLKADMTMQRQHRWTSTKKS